jgi:hypothetical protein
MQLNEGKPPAEWPWYLGSIVATAIAIPAALYPTAAGHGTYIPAILLFPWVMASTALFREITFPAMVGGMVQFPLYGVLLGVGARHGRTRTMVAVVIVLHAIATGLAVAVASSNFR